MSFRYGLVGHTTPDDKYVITSPNVNYIPSPVYGSIKVTMKTDGKFGREDPLQWPQIYSPDRDVCWLACIPRAGSPQRCAGLWTALTLSDFVVSPTSMVSSLGTLCEQRRLALHPKITELASRAEAVEKTHSYPEQLHWLRVSMADAYDRLSFPSTFRDLLRQFTFLERIFCMILAWITWHCDVWKPPIDKPVNYTLMGAFSTDPNVVQKFFTAGVPVWFVRLAETLDGTDMVAEHTCFSEPRSIDTTDSDLAETPVYVGLPNAKFLRRLSYTAYRYLDVDVLPFPEENSLDKKQQKQVQSTTQQEQAQSTAQHRSDSSGPIRTRSSGSLRVKPCKNTSVTLFFNVYLAT